MISVGPARSGNDLLSPRRGQRVPRRRTPVHMSKHLLRDGKVETPRRHTCVPCMQEICPRSGAVPGRFSSREKGARRRWTYVLVCGVRSLCRRFLNQFDTWVRVSPVFFARFFFSSDAGYLFLM